MRARFNAASAWLRNAARDPARDRFWWSEGYQLGRRLGAPIWAAAIALFIFSYVFMWSFVHVHVDMRECKLVLDDPMFRLIPFDTKWFFVTHEIYSTLTLAAVAALVLEALAGDHRPLVVWGTSLGLQALLRSVTLLLLPLCRFTETQGSHALVSAPHLNLGFFSIPWRTWATNDLVFSGHVGEFLLLYWATRHWPPLVRYGLIAFQLLQVYALLGTRGHYTLDVVVAVPCALLEFRLALWLLLRATGQRTTHATA